MNQEQLISEALCLPTSAIDYQVSQHLKTLFPDKAFIQGGDGLFNVEEYAHAQHCKLEQKAVIYSQMMTRWIGPETGIMDWTRSIMRPGNIPSLVTSRWAEREVLNRAKNAWFEVEWQGAMLDVIIMHWVEGMNTVYHYWILADSREIAENFLVAVCAWNVEVRGEVLVFDGGCWQKDRQLFKSIKGATLDNLIMRGTLKQDIYDDLVQFFAARETYETYGIPWKRGIIFVGPPGNGKTHAVKAIINAIMQPCLYVKSFKVEYRTDEENIRMVFDRARKSAPCILVLEDLDALVTPQNRSFFLNELDGFAANIGIVTLATTNHPERLDPAILDRPSRFDRKYPFNLPELEERQAYITMWNSSLQVALQISRDAESQLAEQTEGFSFAYLKELFLSSMMRWINLPGQETMEQIMTGQVEVLREQMVSANALAAQTPVESEGESAPPRFRRPVTRFVFQNGPGF